MVSAEEVLSARVMSKFSRYEHVILGITQFDCDANNQNNGYNDSINANGSEVFGSLKNSFTDI